mgnify:FL=1
MSCIVSSGLVESDLDLLTSHRLLLGILNILIDVLSETVALSLPNLLLALLSCHTVSCRSDLP